MKPYKSFMAQHLAEFAAYRQQLGYARKAIRPPLLAFDRYLVKYADDWQQLQPSFFLELRNTISNHPNTANKMLSNLRHFFNFLVRRQICASNPLKDVPLLPERYFVPFVFSPEQTDKLITAVGTMIRRCQEHLLFDMAVYVALVMLARCGMRINEPLRLCRSSYRPDEGSVYIEKTKFRKDRLIPLPQAVLVELDNYLAARNALCCDDQNPYLLAGRENRPLNDNHIRAVFHRAVETIGIDHPRKIIGNLTFGAPVPHSLRHSFAINTLNRIRAQGKSAQQALPVLAAYLGHRKYQYSAAYLKVKSADDLVGLIAFTKSQLDVV
jgi:integrase/recombinase XerD